MTEPLSSAMPELVSGQDTSHDGNGQASQEALRRSEERLSLVLRAADLGIWDWDLKTDVLSWSERCLSLFGLPPGSEVTYQKFLEALHPDDRERIDLAVRACLERHEDYDVELRTVWPDGAVRWLNCRGRAYYDADGQAARMSGVAWDITERKQAEAALALSGALYRHLFDSDLIGILVSDKYGGVLEVNDCFLNLVGYSRADQKSGALNWVAITPAEFLPLDEKGIAEVALRGSCTPYEKEYIRKDGTRVPILIGYTLMQGTDDCYVAFILDLTAQKRAQAAIRAREQQFRTLADSLPQLIWMLGADLVPEYCNQGFYAYTGLRPEEVIGVPWETTRAHIMHPEDLAATLRKTGESQRTAKDYINEARVRRYDGQYRTFLTRAVPLFNEADQVTRWIGSSTDIEDRKRADEALRRSEKLAVTGRLAASIAHEINNPLMSLTSLVYLLQQEDGLGQKPRDLLHLAEQELARVGQIVTQTLRFSRSSKLPSQADLREIADSVLALFKARLTTAGIEVIRQYDGNCSIVCYGDELRQVIANLVSNAHDAMPRGGRLCVKIRPHSSWSEAGRRGLRITIADDGAGIPAELRASVFEPFVTTKDSTGTGLGLWVASEIVRRHDGKISLRSARKTAGSGTVFSVFLPYDGVAQDAAGATA